MKKKEPEILAYLIRVDEETGKNFRGSFETIPNELKYLQNFVNFGREHGLIQVIRIEDIDIICHDEGKLLQFPMSRAWIEDNSVIDVFCGNLICVRADLSTGDFTSIKESDLPTIQKYLKPVHNLKNGKAMVIPEENWLDEWSDKNGSET